ncbi:hypothetical protein [Streptomyces tagetis]|uniref:Uncharacterized protein n=1 Tax=Streptomyces tagetis TaxID=2820809 RepID=A0A941B122_9ACTN|nr:hypothetical protein [Streptomyces sp. RG38]MBQ0827501.1 hypothetical protein [Streptomyces sp. RG38]
MADRAGGAVNWAVERAPAVIDAAIDALEPASVTAQGIGTALQDSGRGAASFYNWGVALNGASGVRTVFLEGRKALRPHPNDRPDVLAAFLGAARTAGSVAYGFGPTPGAQAAGAVIQSAALGGAWYQQSRQQRQQRQQTRVPAEPPRVSLGSFPSDLSLGSVLNAADRSTPGESSRQPATRTPQNPTTVTPDYPAGGSGRGTRGRETGDATGAEVPGSVARTNGNGNGNGQRGRGRK